MFVQKYFGVILVVTIVGLITFMIYYSQNCSNVLKTTPVVEKTVVISSNPTIINNYGQTLIEVKTEDVGKWILNNQDKEIICIEGTGRGIYGINETFFILYKGKN